MPSLCFFTTLILQTAFLPLPSIARAVMLTLPGALAVTFPAADTVATFGLLLIHVTFLSAASAGEITGTSFTDLPTVSFGTLGRVILLTLAPT